MAIWPVYPQKKLHFDHLERKFSHLNQNKLYFENISQHFNKLTTLSRNHLFHSFCPISWEFWTAFWTKCRTAIRLSHLIFFSLSFFCTIFCNHMSDPVYALKIVAYLHLSLEISASQNPSENKIQHKRAIIKHSQLHRVTKI